MCRRQRSCTSGIILAACLRECVAVDLATGPSPAVTPCAIGFNFCICNVVHHQQIFFSASSSTYCEQYAKPRSSLLAYPKPAVDTGLDPKKCCCIPLADCLPTADCCMPSSELFLSSSYCICKACLNPRMAHERHACFPSNKADNATT